MNKWEALKVTLVYVGNMEDHRNPLTPQWLALLMDYAERAEINHWSKQELYDELEASR